MIRAGILGFFIVATGTQSAFAGAWPRAKGTGFLSSSGTVTQSRDATGALYGEFGLSDRFTLGIDINAGMEQTGLPQGEGVVFLRWPLSAPEATNKWAAQIGIGARYEPLEFYPAVELGLSWGRGLQWRDNYGWAAVDMTFNVAKSPMDEITKLDLTIGMGVSPRFKVMGQAFFTQTEGTLYTTLAPSLLFSPEGSDSTYQLGVEYPLDDDDEPRLKLGVWRSF